MVRRVATILILASLLFALTTVSALALKSPEKARIAHEAISRVIEYSMPDEHDHLWGDGSTAGNYSVPLYSDRATGHGEKMGITWYDYQHNSSMHRQIIRGSDGSGGANDHTIHLEWMYLGSAVQVDRSPNYAFYNCVGGAKSTVADPTQAGEYGGYVSMDVTNGNKAVISCHNDQGAGYEMQVWWQQAPNFAFFNKTSRVPRSVTNVGNTHPTSTDGEVVWPAMAFQEPPSAPNVTHLIASAFGGGGAGGSSFHYLRAEMADSLQLNANWIQGWMDPTGWRQITDTIHNGEGWDLCVSKISGKVAILWCNNPPDPLDPCAGGDTCSQNTSMGAGGLDRWDNDLYLQTSDDYGITWNKRQNITKHVIGTDGFRPFSDMTSMYTTDDVFHAAWTAGKWEYAAQGLFASRIHHWSEALGYPDAGGVDQGPYAGFPGNVRTAGVADWDPVNCSPGSFNRNSSKLNIAECDGKLYIMWVELNSPKVSGNAAQDDCAARAWNNQTAGAANGDLLVAVSGNLVGLTWDDSRPITDTYGGAGGVPGPGAACDGDVLNGGTPCPSEHWPSMTAYGSNKVINTAEITTPTLVLNNIDPSYAGSYYLDISYIDDPDPGGAIMGFGTWQEASVRWNRFPCAEPVPAAGFAMNPNDFDFPRWVKNCEQKDVDVLIENTGNVELTYTATPIEDPGPASGWLTIQDFSGTVPDGFDNKETGIIHLNAGGAICGAPGSVTHVTGRVEFDHNANRTIDNFEIDLIVADTIISIEHDTISTWCFSLTVGNNGNSGNQGVGGVNLDFESMDWKEGQGTYLYDGGTVLSRKIIVGIDTSIIVNYGLFQAGLADSITLMPQGDQSKGDSGWAWVYQTGTYVTNDSQVAMSTSFYAPKDPDSCNVIIKRTTVWSNDGGSHLITIGEAADYDVPSDSASSYNQSGDGSYPEFLATGAQLVFLQGVDQPVDTAQDTTAGSWFAEERYGVLVYLGGYRHTGGVADSAIDTAYGMYTASNITFVYPYTLGFDGDSLYMNMSFSGSTISDSVQDLHVGVSYVFEYDLPSGDSLVFSIAYITNLNAVYPYTAKASSGIAGSVIKAGALYANHLKPEIVSGTCCLNAGDFNDDGNNDVSDLSGPTSLVAFMFLGGPPPPCLSQGDFNGDGNQDVSDLSGPTSMVAFMFLGGPPPVCGPQD